MFATKEISKKTKPAHSKVGSEIPVALVRETIDGIPFYYAGFRSVLNKTKTWKTSWQTVDYDSF